MSKVLRFGLAGTGLIGRKRIEHDQADPDCSIAGIAGPSPQAEDFAGASFSDFDPDLSWWYKPLQGAPQFNKEQAA